MITLRPAGDAGPRYSISAGLDVVVLSADEILVQFGSRSHPSELFRDSDVTGILGRAIGRLLERPATTDELVAAAGPGHEADVRAFVETLVSKGILMPDSADPVDQYLGYSLGGATELGRHTVGVVGCGPLGARIAASLAQHGIGALVVGDDRPPNTLWQRFMPAGLNGAGREERSSSGALRGWLSEHGVRVEHAQPPLDENRLEELLTGTSLTIFALEQVDLRLAHVLNRQAVHARRPWLHAIIDGDFGLVGPLFEPPNTGCYNEFQVLRRAATPSAAMMTRYQRHVLDRGQASFFPGLPVYAELVASYATLAAIHYLLQGSCFALGRAMFINFEQMVIDTDDVLKLPRCPVCSAERRPGRAAFPRKPAAGSQ